MSKKFASSKKSITFAPHLEKCSFRKAEFLRKPRAEKRAFMPRRSQKYRLDSEGIQAEIAQLVEHNLAKVGVAGPSPVFRSLVEQKRVVREGPGE